MSVGAVEAELVDRRRVEVRVGSEAGAACAAGTRRRS